MILKITVNDAKNVAQGACRMKLDFNGKQWSIEEDLKQAWDSVGFSKKGAFEPKDWGVIWIWDQSPTGKQNTVIIWDAPKGESDKDHRLGGGRLFAPKNPAFKDAKISWNLEASAENSIRETILKHCRRILPAAPDTFLTPGKPPMTEISLQKHSVHGETNCPDFPAWIAKQLGVGGLVPEKVKFAKYKLKDGTEVPAGSVGIMNPMIIWEQFALNVERQRKMDPGTVWIPFDTGRSEVRPQPADFYVLVQAPGSAKFQHVGVMVDSTGNVWRTADAGQGPANPPEYDKGMAAGFRNRKFNSDGAMTGEFGDKAWLKGWVNVETLFAGWKQA